MIVSMTAFGRQEGSGEWGQATWEIKSVNHRYLDISIRLPDELRALENRVRELISSKLTRGKVDCILRYDAGTESTAELSVDTVLAERLVKAATSLPISAAAPVNPVDILRWPGVIIRETPDVDAVGDPILKLLDGTLDLVVETRKREGEKIHAMITERCDTAAANVQQVKSELPEITDGIRERYFNRAQELSVELDHDRLEQEMLLLIQKMDVAEELDRLQAHIEEVRRVLNEQQPVGRRLDFLMQEMNREANTLGSKSANITTSNASVELKVNIEQMREQIQNIE